MPNEFREQSKPPHVQFNKGRAASPPNAPQRDAPAGPEAGPTSARDESAISAGPVTPVPDARRFTVEELGRLSRLFQLLDSWDKSQREGRKAA